jgi:hypothetical protein
MRPRLAALVLVLGVVRLGPAPAPAPGMGSLVVQRIPGYTPSATGLNGSLSAATFASYDPTGKLAKSVASGAATGYARTFVRQNGTSRRAVVVALFRLPDDDLAAGFARGVVRGASAPGAALVKAETLPDPPGAVVETDRAGDKGTYDQLVFRRGRDVALVVLAPSDPASDVLLRVAGGEASLLPAGATGFLPAGSPGRAFDVLAFIAGTLSAVMVYRLSRQLRRER